MARRDSKDLRSLYSEKRDSTTKQLHLTRQLVMLHAASTAITSSLDHVQVMDTITREMVNILDAGVCTLSKWDHDRQVVVPLAGFGAKGLGEIEPDQAYPLEACPLTKEVLEKGTPRQKTASQTGISPLKRKTMDRFGGESLLILPLVCQQRVLGILEVYDRMERVYERDEVLVAMLLSDQAAIAVENTNLFTTTQRSLKEQKALRQSALMVSSTLDTDAILARIAEQVCTLVDATSVFISQFDPEHKTSTVIAEHHGPSANQRERVSDLGVVYDHSRDFPAVIKMIESGKPQMYFIDDPDLDDSDRAHLEQYDGHSVLEIPLQIGGRFIAFIEIWDSQNRREFTQNEINLCQTLATQAAIAIDNASLYEQAKREIEQRKQIEARLQYDALHDTLTGLPNRALFLDRLERAILRKSRYDQVSFAVLYLDLDRFKMVNDSLGHSAGDRLLVQVGQLLKNSVRAVDTISRFGGDEFLVLLEGHAGVEDAQALAERILKILSVPISVAGHQMVITASIGIAVSSLEYKNPEEYIQDADMAMYHAKSSGKGRYQFITNTIRSSATRRFTLEAELRRAIKNQEFVLHYQPIVSLNNRSITGFEALVRWENPSSGLIYPNEFISYAEDTGLILELGHWVVEQACKQVLHWQERFKMDPPLTVSVNISGKQLTQPEFIQRVRHVLDGTGLDASSLVLEITENVLIREMNAVSMTLNYLRGLGLKVHLDDFGTGYSSLTYLRDLAINALKIDRSFVSNIDPQNKERGLMHSIVALAGDLGLDVIAEGIETKEQAVCLRDLGCQYGQGFYFKEGQNAFNTEELIAKYLRHQRLFIGE